MAHPDQMPRKQRAERVDGQSNPAAFLLILFVPLLCMNLKHGLRTLSFRIFTHYWPLDFMAPEFSYLTRMLSVESAVTLRILCDIFSESCI